MFVHLGHRRGKLLVESGYENQSSEGEVVGHGGEQKNAANKMATTLPNQSVSEVRSPAQSPAPTARRLRATSPSPPAWPGDYHRLFDDPDRDQTGGAIVRPTPSRLAQLEDDGIVAEQRGQLRWAARIDLVELLGDVTTTWPQNSLVTCL